MSSPRAPLAAGAIVAAVLLYELAPALRLGFSGDDYELLTLARIGGFAGAVLPAPHRGMFAKPVVSALWAALLPVFGARAGAWFACCIATHLLNAGLLGLLASRLFRRWIEPTPSPAAARWAGVLTAAVWAVHDRLLEPVFSVSAWNHSLAFALMATALLLLDGALESRSTAWLRLATLVAFLALLTYEVAISLVAACALLVLLRPARPGEPASAGPRFALPAVLAATALYALLRLLLQWRSPKTSYAFVSLSSVPGNFAGVLAAYPRLPVAALLASTGGRWIAGASGAAILILAAVFIRDRLTRFALGWCAAAALVVSLVPESSDRYHYVPFAALSLAVGRLALACPPLPRIALGVLLAGHLGWSLAAAHEQADWYALKGRFHERLLAQARAGLVVPPAGGSVLAIAWPEPAAPGHPRLEAAASRLPRRFGDPRWPLYLRPSAVDRLIAPRDLMTVAAIPGGPFFRRPDPAVAAEALARDAFRLVAIEPENDPPRGRNGAQGPLGAAVPTGSADPTGGAALRSAIEAAFRTRNEIPVELPLRGGGSWRVEWLQPATREEAFKDEYESGDT